MAGRSSLARQGLYMLLIVAGVTLIGRGGLQWRDRHAAGEVALSFLQAWQRGDYPAAVKLLDPAVRARFALLPDKGFEAFATAEADAKAEVRAVIVDGPTARATLNIDRDGFQIRPVLHLRDVPREGWRVVHVEPVSADPRWEEIREERRRLNASGIQNELSDRLSNAPGIEIERGSLP